MTLGASRKLDVPTLVMHGDDDQIVPIGGSPMLSSKLVNNAQLKVYKGRPYGMGTPHHDVINADLLAFVKSSRAPGLPCWRSSP